METAELDALCRRYDARFGNLDEVARPEIQWEPRFAELLEGALGRGQALTRAEVEAVWPEVAWDE